MDKRDRALFLSLWTEDAKYIVDGPFGESAGLEAIGAMFDGVVLMFTETHHHNVNLVIDGPHGDVASAMSDALVTGTDAEGVAWSCAVSYEDGFRRVGDEWRFTERYARTHYLVPWLSPPSRDPATHHYISPEHAEHLVALGQQLEAERAPS
jgi:ketosteroid isomerase-like protein